MKPVVPNLEVTDINISCATGGTVELKLRGGFANGGKDYWVWMSVTGNWPGIPLNGVTVPLNYDALTELGLIYPLFPGSTGFMGKLDFFGMATATLTLPSDPQQVLLGLPIQFAYVLLAPGPSLPLSYASTPVHVKYVP